MLTRHGALVLVLALGAGRTDYRVLDSDVLSMSSPVCWRSPSKTTRRVVGSERGVQTASRALG